MSRDGFTNIRRGKDFYFSAIKSEEVTRPSSQSTASTESSVSSASSVYVAAARVPAWKLREAAKASSMSEPPISKYTSAPNGSSSQKTMEVATFHGHCRVPTLDFVPSAPVSSVRNSTADHPFSMAFPCLNNAEDLSDDQADTVPEELATRQNMRRRINRTTRASSSDPSSRRSASRHANEILAAVSSRHPSRRNRSSSIEPSRIRSEGSKRSSSREPSQCQSSSREPFTSRRSASQERTRRVIRSEEEPSGTPRTERTAPAQGTRRRMRKSDLAQVDNDAAVPSLFQAVSPPTRYVSSTTRTHSASKFSAADTTKTIDTKTPLKLVSQPPLQKKPDSALQEHPMIGEISSLSFPDPGFPSSFSFDNDDPFQTSCLFNEDIPKKGIKALARKTSKTPTKDEDLNTTTQIPPVNKNLRTIRQQSKFHTSSEEEDLSLVPSLFRVAISIDKKGKKKPRKSTKEDASKSPNKFKQRKITKNLSEPKSLSKTEANKKKTKGISKNKDQKEDEREKKLPDGFDWDIPITPVFETPNSMTIEKTFGSKECVLAVNNDNCDVFHNSLDHLFELPADLLSPSTGKIKMDENTMPIITFSDDASHASDMSSIHSISEYSDAHGHDDDNIEPATRMLRSRPRDSAAMNGKGSSHSSRTTNSRVTSASRGTRGSIGTDNSRRSVATTNTAWRLREQQKHARRPGGRFAHTMHTPNTAPSRPRRAMTTHLAHQQIPLPPAFSRLSAPSTPKTSALCRRLMSNKERMTRDLHSDARRGNIADSLRYFGRDDEEASIEPDLLSQCSRSIYSTRSQNLQKFHKLAENRCVIPKKAKLEVDPQTGEQQIVVNLGDVPAAFRTSIVKKQ